MMICLLKTTAATEIQITPMRSMSLIECNRIVNPTQYPFDNFGALGTKLKNNKLQLSPVKKKSLYVQLDAFY